MELIEETSFKIAGIDPGSHHLGISYVEMNSKGEYLHADGVTIRPINMFHAGFYNDGPVTNLSFYDRISLMLSEIDLIISHINPIYLAIERPFYNRRAPRVYAVLMSQMLRLIEHINNNYPNIGIREYSPLELKKGIGATKMKGKEPIRIAVSTNDDLRDILLTPLQDMSEHAIDALVAAYVASRDFC
jgi:Holliday junction resolvasome RuvABC endonuclease subunit